MNSGKHKSPKSVKVQVADNFRKKQTAESSPKGVTAVQENSPFPLSILSLFTFFALSWLWAGWWMGDTFRIAYERSFFAADATLMHWLWQQSFGSLWILGRALLTLYHWPVVGGLLVASLLTAGSLLFGYCLRLPKRWRWIQYLPAGAWMIWVSWSGLDLFFMHEPGRILGIPLLAVLVCLMDAVIIWSFKRRRRPTSVPSITGGAGERSRVGLLFSLLVIVLIFLLPCLLLNHRHPYFRPLMRMQVQLLHDDYAGMSATAHEHASLSYRPLAAYYAVALTRQGTIAEQLFDVRLEYDSICVHDYDGDPDLGGNYYLIDCDYHSGLIRPAMHRAVEELTMDGPSLFTLKYLAKMSLIENDWALARKYFHILHQAPFEGEFLAKYEPMLERPDLVQADPEFAGVLKAAPIQDSFESFYEKPCFLGYHAVTSSGRTMEALTLSVMANLYSKRMPDFLMRCQPFVGTTPPRSIAEGLITQTQTHPEILQAFPQLQMDAQRFRGFIQVAQSYMQDRPRGAEELFNQFCGYYPYYYFFGNLRATRKSGDSEKEHSKAGVN